MEIHLRVLGRLRSGDVCKVFSPEYGKMCSRNAFHFYNCQLGGQERGSIAGNSLEPSGQGATMGVITAYLLLVWSVTVGAGDGKVTALLSLAPPLPLTSKLSIP